MAMAYITFRGVNSGPCVGFYRKQALADAAATDNSGVVAHTGVLDVGTLEPRESYFNGTAVVSEEAHEAVLLAARTDTQKLQDAARALHDLYNSVIQAAEDHGLADYFPRDHVNWFHDFEIFAHRGTRGVFLSDNLTVNQKLAWAAANGLGPTDIYPAGVAVPTFSQIAATVFGLFEGWPNANNVPTEAICFADPTDASRWALADCKSMTAGLAAGVLADETTDVADYIDGVWIANITA